MPLGPSDVFPVPLEALFRFGRHGAGKETVRAAYVPMLSPPRSRPGRSRPRTAAHGARRIAASSHSRGVACGELEPARPGSGGRSASGRRGSRGRVCRGERSGVKRGARPARPGRGAVCREEGGRGKRVGRWAARQRGRFKARQFGLNKHAPSKARGPRPAPPLRKACIQFWRGRKASGDERAENRTDNTYGRAMGLLCALVSPQYLGSG